MTIDDALIRPVNHYIKGNGIGFALTVHSEVSLGINLAELKPNIEAGRDRCISACEDMLRNPVDYAKLVGYQLKPKDKAFLKNLLTKAREIDWMDSAQVRELSDYVGSYVPENLIEQGFRGTS